MNVTRLNKNQILMLALLKRVKEATVKGEVHTLSVTMLARDGRVRSDHAGELSPLLHRFRR